MLDVKNQPVKIIDVADIKGEIVCVGDQKAWEGPRRPGENTIAYWKLDSVNTVNDLSGRNNNLTNASVVFGNSGGVDCAQFNTGRYMYVNTISGYPSGTTQKTFNRWASYKTRSASQYCWTVYGGDTATRTYFHIPSTSASTNPSQPRIYSNGNTIYSGSANRPDGTWKNYVVVFDGTKTYIYINGVKAVDGTFTWATNSPSSSNPFVIGRQKTSDTSYQTDTCNLSRFIIENRGWTAEEILKYFNETKAIFGIS